MYFRYVPLYYYIMDNSKEVNGYVGSLVELIILSLCLIVSFNIVIFCFNRGIDLFYFFSDLFDNFCNRFDKKDDEI